MTHPSEKWPSAPERIKMRHNDISEICREVLVNTLGLKNDDEIPQQPWDRIVYKFADKNKDNEWTKDELIQKFRTENAKQLL